MTDAGRASLLRDMADRIDQIPSVVRRSGGAAGAVAAYLPGERITGLRVTADGRLQVHVVMAWGSTVDEVESQVLAAVEGLWTDGPVDLTVDDIEPLPTPQLDAAGPADAGSGHGTEPLSSTSGQGR